MQDAGREEDEREGWKEGIEEEEEEEEADEEETEEFNLFPPLPLCSSLREASM